MSAFDGITYLDYAATSAVRPPDVARAVNHYLTDIGASPGRGGHRLAIAADRVALHCRQSLARLLDIPGDPGRIAFMPNATYGINTALRGMLRDGDRVVITVFDHNAVVRAAHQLAGERDIEIMQVDGDPTGALDEAAFDRTIDGARVVVLNAVSNVLGTALDIPRLAARAHAAGALVLVDAAQCAGHMPFSVSASQADVIAFTGHKGLLGPQGSGALWVRDTVDVQPLVSGGTGGDSANREMPSAYPDHLEAGTINGPAIAGLGAGADWLLSHDVAAQHARVQSLTFVLCDALHSLPHVRVHSPLRPAAAIVTITSDRVDPPTLATRLDREAGVLTRAGLHCAPDAHRLIGTLKAGAVRLSPGWASTEADVQRAVDAIDAITRPVAVAQSAPT